jgi:Ca2+-binding EF-hand superfamily protein
MALVEQFERRLKVEIAQKRVRPKEFFVDYDPLRKGEVTEPQFKRAIGMMNIPYTDEELTALSLKYKVDNIRSNYFRFCEAMDSPFYDQRELSPVKAAFLQTGEVRLSVTEQETLKAALQEFKYIMQTERVMVKPVFQDFDRSKTGHVSKSQFIRTLTTTKLLPKNPEVTELIVRFYTDGPLGANYEKFTRDVDQVDMIGGIVSGPIEEGYFPVPEVQPQIPQPMTSTRFFDTRQPQARDLLDVELRLRAEVAMKRIRASEFFRDFDVLRKGTVGTGQFRVCLGMLNLRISDVELEQIIEKYSEPGSLVRYLEFIQFIESAPESLEKNPESRFAGPTSTLPARRKYLEFTRQEAETLEAALQEYQDAIRSRRVHVRPMFKDFDRTNSGHISRTQFTRVLNQAMLFPPEPVLALLIKRYLDKGNMEEVNYRDFCIDVDSPEFIYFT